MEALGGGGNSTVVVGECLESYLAIEIVSIGTAISIVMCVEYLYYRW